MARRSLIPALEQNIDLETKNHGSSEGKERVFWMVTGVFAVQRSAEDYMENIQRLWHDRPSGRFDTNHGGRLTLHH